MALVCGEAQWRRTVGAVGVGFDALVEEGAHRLDATLAGRGAQQRLFGILASVQNGTQAARAKTTMERCSMMELFPSDQGPSASDLNTG